MSNAFQSTLTDIGLRALHRIKLEISDRFKKWDTTVTAYKAPIVSLCQSSGFGKSKLSIELIKRNPGFYVVFRKELDSAYPPQTTLQMHFAIAYLLRIIHRTKRILHMKNVQLAMSFISLQRQFVCSLIRHMLILLRKNAFAKYLINWPLILL